MGGRSGIGADELNLVPDARGREFPGASMGSMASSVGRESPRFPEATGGGTATPPPPRTTSVQLPRQSTASAVGLNSSAGVLSPSSRRSLEPLHAPPTATSRAKLPSLSIQSASAWALGKASPRQSMISVAVLKIFMKLQPLQSDSWLASQLHYSLFRLSCPVSRRDQARALPPCG